MSNRPTERPWVKWKKIIHSELVELLAAGMRVKDIAKYFNCSYPAVYNYIRHHDLPVELRGYKKYSIEQKKDIIAMAKKGIPIKCIAEIHKRNYDCIRLALQLWGVNTNYHIAGAKANGMYGPPVSNNEIIDKWNHVFAWLRKRYRHLTVEELTDAVNQSSIELRRIPRQATWLTFWHTIAASRAIDVIREKVSLKRNGAKCGGKAESYIDEIPSEDRPEADYVDLQDEVRAMLEHLPSRLRRVVKLKMKYGYAEGAKRMKVAESSFYRLLDEAYSIIRSKSK